MAVDKRRSSAANPGFVLFNARNVILATGGYGNVFDLSTYARGEPQTRLEQTGKTDRRGTKVTFKPDAQIFESVEFNYETLTGRLREVAFLNRGLKVVVSDLRTNQTNTYKFDGGIAEFVQFINRSKTCLHEKPIYVKVGGARPYYDTALAVKAGADVVVLDGMPVHKPELLGLLAKGQPDGTPSQPPRRMSTCRPTVRPEPKSDTTTRRK